MKILFFSFLYVDTRKLCLFHDYHSQVETEINGECWRENNSRKGVCFQEEFAYKNNIYFEKPAKIYFWIMAIFMHVSFESRKF